MTDTGATSCSQTGGLSPLQRAHFRFQLVKNLKRGVPSYKCADTPFEEIFCAWLNAPFPFSVLLFGRKGKQDRAWEASVCEKVNSVEFLRIDQAPNFSFHSPQVVLISEKRELWNIWSSFHKDCKYDDAAWFDSFDEETHWWSVLFFQPTTTLLFTPVRQCFGRASSLGAKIRVDEKTRCLDDREFCGKFGKMDMRLAIGSALNKTVPEPPDCRFPVGTHLYREGGDVEYKLCLTQSTSVLDILRENGWTQFIGLLNAGHFSFIFGVADHDFGVYGDLIQISPGEDIHIGDDPSRVCKLLLPSIVKGIFPPLSEDRIQCAVAPLPGTRPSDWTHVYFSQTKYIDTVPHNCKELMDLTHDTVARLEGRCGLFQLDGKWCFWAGTNADDPGFDGEWTKLSPEVAAKLSTEVAALISQRNVIILDVRPPGNAVFVDQDQLQGSVKWFSGVAEDGGPIVAPLDGFFAWLRLQDPFARSNSALFRERSQYFAFFQDKELHEQTVPLCIWEKTLFYPIADSVDYSAPVVLLVEPLTIALGKKFVEERCSCLSQNVIVVVCIPMQCRDRNDWLKDFLEWVDGPSGLSLQLYGVLSPSPISHRLWRDGFRKVLMKCSPPVVVVGPDEWEFSVEERYDFAKKLFHDINSVQDDEWPKLLAGKVVAMTLNRQELLESLKTRVRDRERVVAVSGQMSGIGLTSTLRLFAHELVKHGFAVHWFKEFPADPALLIYALTVNAESSGGHSVLFADRKERKDARKFLALCSKRFSITLVCPHDRHISKEVGSGFDSGTTALRLTPFLEKKDLKALQKPFPEGTNEHRAIEDALASPDSDITSRHWFVVGLAVTSGRFFSAADLLKNMWNAVEKCTKGRKQLEILAFLSGFAPTVFPLIERDSLDGTLLSHMELGLGLGFKFYDYHVPVAERGKLVCFYVHPYFARRLLFTHILAPSGTTATATDFERELRTALEMPLNPEKIAGLWYSAFEMFGSYLRPLKRVLYRRCFGERLPRVFMAFVHSDSFSHEQLDEMITGCGMASVHHGHSQIAMSRLQRLRLEQFTRVAPDEAVAWPTGDAVAVVTRAKTEMLRWSRLALGKLGDSSNVARHNHAVCVVAAAKADKLSNPDHSALKTLRDEVEVAYRTLSQLYEDATKMSNVNVLSMDAKGAFEALQLLLGLGWADVRGFEKDFAKWQHRAEKPVTKCPWWSFLHIAKSEAIMWDDGSAELAGEE